MTLVPRTLLGRIAAVIALTLLVSQVASTTVFRYWQAGPHASLMTLLATGQVKAAAVALRTLTPDERARYMAQFQDPQGIRIERATPGAVPPGVPPEPPPLREFERSLRAQLGDDTRLYVREQPGRGLWVTLNVDGEPYWITMPRSRLERPFTWRWGGLLAVGALFSLLGAYVLVRVLNRPLQALTEAAARVARGDYPAPLPERGPVELRAVTGTFNRMTDHLRQVDQDRALLLAGISHDLRTPLARLRLGVEMVEGSDDGTRAGMIEDIEDIDRIIGQFLSYARDGTEEAPSQGDFNLLVRDCTDRAARQGLTAEVDLAPLPPLPFRAGATQRMIDNLLSNVVRYGAGRATISTRVEGDAVVLRVSDQGPGVPEDQLERMIRPFTRLDSARGGGPGTGLGLTIVDRIARLHGGSLRLSNRPGGGLEARVAVPLRGGDEPATRKTFSGGEAAGETRAALDMAR